MEKPTSFAVIVPCYNESGNIEKCARGLIEQEQFDEIILVDDGSTDGTSDLCELLMERYGPRLTTYHLPENKGKNYALRIGAQRARADVVIIYDADLTVSPADLSAIKPVFGQNLNNFVYGSRFIRKMEKGAMSRLNRWGNAFFAYWVSGLLNRRVTDVLCGVKAISRRNFLAIDPTHCRWGDFDLFFGAARQKLGFHEIPVFYKKRRAGASKMKVMKAGLGFFQECVRYSFRAKIN
ncbi:MAG: glycosyltransferase family 2 protein [Lewinellaceae bacterium]|nr:glycosyltransferase family 2 protein [Lewinellaceae bacterium]MCB9289786.1 glycosyltransferase family 2 protein [Lewinellaceae bacterium]